MPLTNSFEMFKKAYKGNYAVGAFNVDNVDILAGVVSAAAKTESPVILAITERSRAYFHPTYLSHAVKAACRETDVPIVLHLDHGKSFEICKTCIDDGYTSVMIDASSKPFEENIAITKKVVEFAHERGVVVEGELGVISGIEDELVVSDKYGKFTHPDAAAEFIERTGIDSLAIAIGTAHGAFKFKPGQVPQLRFDILDDIQRLKPGFPLVLHGASSVPHDRLEIFNKFGGKIDDAAGVPEDMLRKAAEKAVCKINVGSDLRICYLGELRRTLFEHAAEIDARVFLTPAREAVETMVMHKIKNVLGSAGKAF